MDNEFAQQFTSDWLDASNAHDLESILGHFTDEIVFTSPLARQIVEGSDGVIHDKEELRAYWNEGLRRSPKSISNSKASTSESMRSSSTIAATPVDWLTKY